MIRVSSSIEICESDVEFRAVHSGGPGGQHVNKVATGIHLRFDIEASSLPRLYKARLLAMADQRITSRGVIVIKARAFKSLEKNKADALHRLIRLIRSAGVSPKARKPTRPTRASRERRLASKTKRSQVKSLRRRVDY